ncbi:MAG: DUF4168 domain-containing protein [Desulfotignum sp.]
MAPCPKPKRIFLSCNSPRTSPWSPNQNLQQAVQQTENMDERRKLQIKANEDMVRAAESAGLDFKAYNHIMQQVRSNTQMEMLFQEKLKSLE